jgi:arylsulfatase A-like enzyme
MERMVRKERNSTIQSSKDRNTLEIIHLLGIWLSFISLFTNCSLDTDTHQKERIAFDLTRELGKESTFRNGEFSNERDPIPSHWKKNPGRFSKLLPEKKWWNSQITFNTNKVLFINESKDSILIPPSKNQDSSIQFKIQKSLYKFSTNIGLLVSRNGEKPQGTFQIKSGGKILYTWNSKLESLESWEKMDLDLNLEEDLTLIWKSQNSFLVLGSPLLLKKINTQSPNIILIVIDAARKDFFPTYGFPYEITPNISVMAKESIVFENPFANGNWTKPSMISFFHSEYSSNMGIHNLWFATQSNHKKIFYEKKVDSIAEILRQNSYYTKSIMNNVFLLDYTTVGVDLGFHSSFQIGKDIEDTEVLTSEAIKFLDEKKSDQFFLHWNLNTPHGGYAPPKDMMEEIFVRVPTSELSKIDPPIRRYMGEIFYTDFVIGKFIAKLKELDLYDNSMIIITGDHGELFDPKHDYHYRYILQGLYGHGETHYDEEINVPWIVKLPKNQQAILNKRTIGGQVSLISLLPTLLGLAGIQYNSEVTKGIDYSNCILTKNNCPQEKYIYTEGRMSESIRTLDYKYIRRYQGYSNVNFSKEGAKHSMPEELYDLKKDPKEHNNLSTQVEGINLLKTARINFNKKEFLIKNRFHIYLPKCMTSFCNYKINLQIPSGIYKIDLPKGMTATTDNFRSTIIQGNLSSDLETIQIHTVNPEPNIVANFSLNGKELNYRIGKWGIQVQNSSQLKENLFLLSAREPTGFRKSILPWIYNDGRLSGEYENETQSLMGQEVRKILESWGYIHE